MIYRTPLTFLREDLELAGQLFRNTDHLFKNLTDAPGREAFARSAVILTYSVPRN